MALKEQDIVFTTTDEAGNTVIQFPITRVENVEDAVRTVNKKKPDSNGDIQIDVDMSHLATKDELTKGLANKRDHTIQIANADLNTLLDAQNLGFRSCRRRRKTVDLLVAQANPGHSRG